MMDNACRWLLGLPQGLWASSLPARQILSKCGCSLRRVVAPSATPMPGQRTA